MFDTRGALRDMAKQIRNCRDEDRLTLQQLATRSGVAASTIHKIEAQQMVPTVSVLLKIAKGLGKRPEELIRDSSQDEQGSGEQPEVGAGAANTPHASSKISVWHLDLAAKESLPSLDLEPLQRAIVLVEMGALNLVAGNQKVVMDEGDCIAVEGGQIESPVVQPDPTRLTIVGSPPGDLANSLGSPSVSSTDYR